MKNKKSHKKHFFLKHKNHIGFQVPSNHNHDVGYKNNICI